jgi:ectoine hydroxylase-related dioxygenase (phytanoyl-CoA dioxygenase family)
MKISRKERDRGRLSEAHLAEAVRHVRETGFVILEKALPLDWVATMRAAFDEELARAAPDRGAGNGGRGGCHAPLCMPFLDPLVIENPIGLQIIEALMGADVWTMLPYHTNTSWPGATMQHIHRDAQHLFPELPVVLPPTLLVLNIPLVDFTEENGSTEVWPGSHLVPDAGFDGRNGEQLAERAAAMPSVRTNMPAGSILVRDMRAWHRGTPNHTDVVRTMIAIVYFRQLHRLPDHLAHLPTIPQRVKDQLSERAQRLFRYNPVTDA